ncbi:MAG: CotH kinase family protein [Lachnospiraceae bacterium]|nr:CotH kinase family protein [Lachnospiraceae bacterium]
MKKVFMFFMAMMAVMALSACGEKEESVTATPAITSTPTSASTPTSTSTPTPSPYVLMPPEGETIYEVLNLPVTRKISTYVFSITGDPADLTDAPFGLFYGKNYSRKGVNSEKPVYVRAWDKDGNVILDQFAGLRIYGAFSRQNYLKSVKLFARESYDPGNKNFRYNFFNTEKLYEDGYVKKYKKLVLRDSGNDYQFAWIRDELAQTLASEAGFTDYEAVAPAIYFINGEYRGFYWLHETYCDNYFKNKYGDKGKNGEFAIVEGSETKKNVTDDDADNVKAAKAYNTEYAKLIKLDLTDMEAYEQLCAFMDVENYIKYYAFNIFIGNKDWPDNNYKCYRYYAAEGEDYEEGTIYDGRWRFLLHDMDYGMGLYDQKECKANYDTLEAVLEQKIKDDKNKTVTNKRYAPLFANLMKREDCRDLFVSFVCELAEGALSYENVNRVLNEMNDERSTEMKYFYSYLEQLRKNGESSIWAWSHHLEGYTNDIRNFFQRRGTYMKQYLEKNFEIELKFTD